MECNWSITHNATLLISNPILKVVYLLCCCQCRRWIRIKTQKKEAFFDSSSKEFVFFSSFYANVIFNEDFSPNAPAQITNPCVYCLYNCLVILFKCNKLILCGLRMWMTFVLTIWLDLLWDCDTDTASCFVHLMRLVGVHLGWEWERNWLFAEGKEWHFDRDDVYY